MQHGMSVIGARRQRREARARRIEAERGACGIDRALQHLSGDLVVVRHLLSLQS